MRGLALDPRTKLILAIEIAALFVIISDPVLLAAGFLLVGGVAIALGHLPSWLKLLQLVLPMTAFLVLVMYFSFDLPTIAATALRLLAMTSVFFLFFQTTTPEDLANSLIKIGVPYAFAFIVATAMEFVPVLTRQMQNVMDAQRARGIRLEANLASVRNYPALFAPLLIQSFTLADQLAEAMETRGFGAPHRTFAVDYRLCMRDYVVLVLSFGLMVLVWRLQIPAA